MSTRINLWAADHGDSHEPGGSDVSQPGLKDLIAGITPTLSGWTVDPTDAAGITDGNISTFCTTGNKVIGAGWQYAYFEWDLGAFYNVLCTGVLGTGATAGTGRSFIGFYDGSGYLEMSDDFVFGSSIKTGFVSGGHCSKVRIGITSDAASTVTPNIREFNVWRVA